MKNMYMHTQYIGHAVYSRQLSSCNRSYSPHMNCANSMMVSESILCNYIIRLLTYFLAYSTHPHMKIAFMEGLKIMPMKYTYAMKSVLNGMHVTIANYFNDCTRV